MMKHVPKTFPTNASSFTIKPDMRARFGPAYRRAAGAQKFVFKHEIEKRFSGVNSLIKPNLIVVGSSVMNQWENAIRDTTPLKVMKIGNIHDLKKFQEFYNTGKLRAFDIILLKNGTVTGSFVLPGEDPASVGDYRSLISTVAKITRGSCWSRVIYDDFDTIKIPPGSAAIDALFTIYVSATTKTPPVIKGSAITYGSLIEAFNARPIPLAYVTADTNLFTTFNIRNNAEFTEKSTNIPIVKKFRYVYANPDDNYIRLLGAMGEEDANNVMEMLNGDAIATAAEAMGIKSGSAADIFKRMLDKKYERFMNDQYVLETIEKTKIEMDALDEHPEGKRHTGAELDAIRSSIAKKIVPNCKFYSLPLEQTLDEMEHEYTLAKEQDGLAINRVIDNIKEGTCQVCALPLTSMDAFIVRCCGLIVCDVCGIKGNQIQKRYDYKTKSNTICGACANCKAVVYPQTDLIFVDRNFDMAALMQAKGDEKPAEPVAEIVEVVEEGPKKPEIKNPKLKALLQLINGEVPENREVVTGKIKHLLEGRVDIPQPAGIEKKLLVFAGFNETLNTIENFLVEHNVKFLRLGGNFNEMAATVKKLRTYGTVLLINSQQHYA